MEDIKVIKDKCIGCKLCINDCPAKCIDLVDNKAEINNLTCIKCGHCIAICPMKAVETDEENMKQVIEYKEEDFNVEADNLLNFIKFRRSTRRFKEMDVEKEKIEKILEAGRYTQTSRNTQDVSYVVIKENIDQLRELVLEGLNEKGLAMLQNMNEATKPFEKYARMWVAAYENYKNNPNAEDRIFFNAPAVIAVVSSTPVNGALASTNMELMTNALGLGTFYSGFTIRAAQGNEKIREFLGLKGSEEIITCMVIGYPAVKYKRTVPRNESKISWK